MFFPFACSETHTRSPSGDSVSAPRSNSLWWSEQRHNPFVTTSGPPAECHRMCAASTPTGECPTRTPTRHTAQAYP